MKKRFAVIKNEKGLTLVELLAVLVIFAIIIAIAIPAIGNIVNNSRDKAILAEASNILQGAKLAELEGVCTERKCEQDDLKNHVEGVKDGATYSASKSEDGKWTVNFSRLADIKNKKYKLDGTAIDEQTLKEYLDGKNKEKTGN